MGLGMIGQEVLRLRPREKGPVILRHIAWTLLGARVVRFQGVPELVVSFTGILNEEEVCQQRVKQRVAQLEQAMDGRMKQMNSRSIKPICPN
eukprot:4240595-Amphidinium_carterae.1